MSKLIPWSALLVCAGLVCLLSTSSKTKNEATGSNRPKAAMSDSAAENRVRNKLSADPQLIGSDIKVSTDTGEREIKLSGTVGSEDTRDKAIQLTQSAFPDFAVSDTIDVKPREMARVGYDDDQQLEQQKRAAENRGDHVGESAQDVHIYSQILSKFSSSQLPLPDIRIDVESGVVTLHGSVPNNKERSEAQRDAQQVRGVKRLDNKLEIGNPARGDQNRPKEGREAPPQTPPH